MNLTEQFGASFLEVCKAYREAGFTDLHLVAGEEGHLRCNEGLTRVTPQSPAAVVLLAEMIFGADKVRELESGEVQSATWQGMRVSAAKPSPLGRMHVAVRL